MKKLPGGYSEQNKLFAKVTIGLWLGLVAAAIITPHIMENDAAQAAGLGIIIPLFFLTPMAAIAFVWLLGMKLSTSKYGSLRVTGKVVLIGLVVAIVAVIGGVILEVTKQSRSNESIPKAEVLQMISNCQIRQVRFEGKRVNLEYFKDNNKKYQKYWTDGASYNEYVDAARAVADKCRVRYFNMVLGGGSSSWSTVEEAKQKLLSCQVSRVSVTDNPSNYGLVGSEVPTNVLIHDEGYKDVFIEVKPGLEYDQILAIKSQVTTTCGPGTRWLKLGENAYQ